MVSLPRECECHDPSCVPAYSAQAPPSARLKHRPALACLRRPSTFKSG